MTQTEVKKRRKLRVDLTGKKVGKLLVLSRSEKVVRGSTFWLCACDCGNFTTVRHGNLNDKKNPTKSCGCETEKNLSKIRDSVLYGEAAKLDAYNRYKCETRRKVEFLLSFEEAVSIFEQNCFYCGTQPSNISKNRHGKGDYLYSGIDRVDNSKDYILDNCVPCCKECNFAKGKISYNEFMSMVQAIYRNKNLENDYRY